MAWSYDPENVFAKILRGEIPNRTVFEDEHALAFEDLRPQAPVHVLVIPKGPYASMDHFAAEASEAEIAGWVRAIGEVTRITGASVSGEVGGGGFRVISNAGADAVQEVPHLHVHVVGGRALGRILPDV
jgi:histidine triad (HIT) family protein